MDWLQKTREMLENNRGAWPAIAIQADVGYDWISRVATGRISNPGILGVQRIHDVLEKMEKANRRRRRMDKKRTAA